MTKRFTRQHDTPRKPILLFGLLGVVILLAVGEFWATAPTVVHDDTSPVDFALGDHVGNWLKNSGCTEVVAVDTDWPLPHLQRLAAKRNGGLRAAVKTLPLHWILADGIEGRKKAWNEAVARCGPGTALVAFHGLFPGAPLPATYKYLVVIGESDGRGLPQDVLAKATGRIIKARASPLAPVNSPTWKGTTEERFAAAYEDLELKPAKNPAK